MEQKTLAGNNVEVIAPERYVLCIVVGLLGKAYWLTRCCVGVLLALNIAPTSHDIRQVQALLDIHIGI